MAETTVEVKIPAVLLEYGLNELEVQQRITEWLVLSLFTEDHISSGKAAQLLGINRLEFLALLRRRSIAFIDYSPEDLQAEFKAVENLPFPPPK